MRKLNKRESKEILNKYFESNFDNITNNSKSIGEVANDLIKEGFFSKESDIAVFLMEQLNLSIRNFDVEFPIQYKVVDQYTQEISQEDIDETDIEALTDDFIKSNY